MDPQAPTPDAKIQARRRLIRGSFSVPAVLAVHNGSALAARSNQFRCVLNQTPSTGGAAPGLTDTTLDWVRVPRYKRNGANEYYVNVAALAQIASTAGLGYGGPAGTSASVSVDGGAATSAFWLPWHSSGSPAAPSGPLTTNGSVAVLFESSSVGTPPTVVVKVVGFVKEGQTTAGAYRGASTRSCWTSIR